MVKKKITLVIILTLLLTMMTSCMEYERGVEIKADGDVEIYAQCLVNKSLLEASYDDDKEEFYDSISDTVFNGREPDFIEEVETKRDGKVYAGVRMSYELGDEDIEEAINGIMEDKCEVRYETSGSFIKTVTIELRYYGHDGLGEKEKWSEEEWNSAEDADQDRSEIDKEVEEALSTAMRNDFSITVPYPILKTNGSTGGAFGKVAKWSLLRVDVARGKKIVMKVTYLSLPAMILLTVLAFLILVLLVVVMFKLVKKIRMKIRSGKSDTTEQEDCRIEEAPDDIMTPENTEDTKDVPDDDGKQEIQDAEKTDQGDDI